MESNGNKVTLTGRSLLDVLRFYAMHFNQVMGNLNAVQAFIQASSDGEMMDGVDFESKRQELLEVLEAMRFHIENLPLEASVKKQYERVLEYAKKATPVEALATAVLARDFREAVIHDLDNDVMLVMPRDKWPLYEMKERPFGDEVSKQFPAAADDIAAASRCLALEEWTACVFHSMRSIEKGLHYLARVLNVNVPGEVEFNDWAPIVAEMEKEIEKLAQLPKGQNKDEALQFYSHVAMNFKYFRDGWRNPNSHSRQHHDEKSAPIVYDHAKIFMQELAIHCAANP